MGYGKKKTDPKEKQANKVVSIYIYLIPTATLYVLVNTWVI